MFNTDVDDEKTDDQILEELSLELNENAEKIKDKNILDLNIQDAADLINELSMLVGHLSTISNQISSFKDQTIVLDKLNMIEHLDWNKIYNNLEKVQNYSMNTTTSKEINQVNDLDKLKVTQLEIKINGLDNKLDLLIQKSDEKNSIPWYKQIFRGNV